jgi:hypothetical protein
VSSVSSVNRKRVIVGFPYILEKNKGRERQGNGGTAETAF